jgi:hypothetical protein
VLHVGFGVACGWVGCPEVGDMWLQGYAADVWMLFGVPLRRRAHPRLAAV